MLDGCSNLLECENTLSQVLPGVKLLGQLPFADSDVEKLGRLIAKVVLKEADATTYLRRYAPISFMCFLVWRGVTGYREGDYWSAVRHWVAGLDVNLQQKWGRLFINLLRQYDLPTFEIKGSLRYVTPILAHGMIPEYCLPDFFTKVLQPLIRRDLVNPTDEGEIIFELQTRRRWHDELEAKERQLRAEEARLLQRLKRLRRRLKTYELLIEARECERLAGDLSDLRGLPEDYWAYTRRVTDALKDIEARIGVLLAEKESLQAAISRFTLYDAQVVARASEIQTLQAAEIEALKAHARDLTVREGSLVEALSHQAAAFLTEGWREEHGRCLLAISWPDLRREIATLLDARACHERIHEELVALQQQQESLTRAHVRAVVLLLILAITGILLLGRLSPLLASTGLLLLGVTSWRRRVQYTYRRRLLGTAVVEAKTKMQECEKACDAGYRSLASKLQGLPVNLGDPPSLALIDGLEALAQTYQELSFIRHEREEVENRLQANIATLNHLAIELGVEPRGTPTEVISTLSQMLTGALERSAAAKRALQQLRDHVEPGIATLEEEQETLLQEKGQVNRRLASLGDGVLEEGLRRYMVRLEARNKAEALWAKLRRYHRDLEDLEVELTSSENIQSQMEEEKHLLATELKAVREKKGILREEIHQYPFAFPGVDEPIRRFLLYGAGAAETFLIAAVHYAHAVMTNNLDNILAGLRLPERVQRAFVEWWHAVSVTEPSPTDKSVPRHGTASALRFDPVAQEIVVHLAAQTLGEDFDGESLYFGVTSKGLVEESLERPVHVYRVGAGRFETDPVNVPLPGPAPAYSFYLRCGSSRLAGWIQTGLTSERPFLAFSERGRWAGGSELPLRPHWIVMGAGYHPPAGAIRESGKLYGAWKGYSFYLVDLTAGFPPILEGPDGTALSIPTQQETAGGLQLGIGRILMGVTCDGDAVYVGEAPDLSISIEPGAPLQFWLLDIVPERGSFPDTVKHCFLSDLVSKESCRSSSGYVISLADDRLLSDRCAGRFRIRVRGPGARPEWLNLCIVPDLKVSFEYQLYVPRRRTEEPKPIRVTLSARYDIRFEPITPVQVLSSQAGKITLEAQKGLEELELIRGILQFPLEEGNMAWLPLELQIPRLQWRIEGLRGDSYSVWRNRVEEIDLADWEASEELHLLVRLPSFIRGNLRLLLEGAPHHATGSIREGQARFELRGFIDTLREGPPVRTFVLLSEDPGVVSMREGVALFQVRTRWEATTVRWEHSLEGTERVLNIEWTEIGRAGDRVVRLWWLAKTAEPLVEESVPAGVCRATIRKEVIDLPHGEYLLEIAEDDPWRPATFPGRNAPNTLILELKGGEVLPPPAKPVEGLVIDSVEDPDIRRPLRHSLNGQYVIWAYSQREGLEPNVYLGKVTIIPAGGKRAEISWEDSVYFEYDADAGCITFMQDKDRDGAYFCRRCRKIFWSQEEYDREVREGHKGALCVPERFWVRPSHGKFQS